MIAYLNLDSNLDHLNYEQYVSSHYTHAYPSTKLRVNVMCLSQIT